jgi:hypothetical protein
LEEGGDGRRGVDLDDPVEVSDVDAELKRAGGDDDTVACLGEGLFGAPSFVQREGGVGQERRDASQSQFLPQFLHQPP